MENYKLIPGTKDYAIDKLGNVYSLRRKHYTHGKVHVIEEVKKLKITELKNDYAYVTLIDYNGKNKVTIPVHRLVAKTFLKKPKGDNWVINHKDGDKHNNRLSNLEYIKQKDNVQHAYDKGLYKDKGKNRVDKERIKIKIENNKTSKLDYLMKW